MTEFTRNVALGFWNAAELIIVPLTAIIISWLIAEALWWLLGTTIRALANRFIFRNEE